MFDTDTLIAIKREEEGERQDTNETKNRIIKISDPVRKMKEWQKYFPTPKYTEDNVVY